MDPRPLLPGRDGNDPARDSDNDDSAPYAIPIGQVTQMVVMDLAIAGSKALTPGGHLQHGNQAIQSTFAAENPGLSPPGQRRARGPCPLAS